MNEIVALMYIKSYFSSYFCFANDESVFLKQQAEVDTFYCFSILMSELKENFSKTNSSGLEHNEFLRDRIRLFSDLLKKVDAKLFDHL